MRLIDYQVIHKRIRNRIIINKVMKTVFLFYTLFSLFVLGILILQVLGDSIGWLDWQFLTSKLSLSAEKAGIKGVIVGTVWLMAVVAPATMILGVGTAIYLEEYANHSKFQSFIQTNISNLAGVPSVIFGLLGLTVFGRMFDLGSSILAGGLTLSLLVLPIVVVSSQEAIRAVPQYLREASYGMGATKWQTTKNVVLPTALPGILTGVILALSRAIGETAPLIVLGIPALLMPIPDHIMDDFTTLPIQIYYWTVDSVLTKEYANLAAATIVVLLFVLFLMNSIAIFIRNKFQKRY
ncbi:phosphate ABC transporter permease PstA [Calidifontibacillus erzurumensis]|uniref:Phosphate transport system permease protein PstA n=1 Tax=Calidifontibacillus erzurumensis TaxID=2741433 RepID=A0A8J8GAP0_9BACI|nr:phosphate ABC transporter permease PstA [Calidifontibacillus erzurumensis]NSL50329.1 phosphate ABC transporter permease PstA [Calidifontibacillus erzurumensis]